MNDFEYQLCVKIHKHRYVKRLAEYPCFKANRGEINQTTFRDYICDDRTKARLLKGVEVGRYCVHDVLSQGQREWFDEQSFLIGNERRPLALQRRIATQRITGVDERWRVVATIVDPLTYFADSTNSISLTEASSRYRLEYVLAILNSKLIQWRFKATSTNNNVGTNELDSLPIREINLSDPSETSYYDRIVELVACMFQLHKDLAAAKTPGDKTLLERQIAATDDEIDRLVYELYGLTEEEIRIVEEATGGKKIKD